VYTDISYYTIPTKKKAKSLRGISEESVKQRRELLDLLAEKQHQKNKGLFKLFLEDVKKKT